MSTKAEAFAQLHRTETPLLMPNPWDAGSAKVFASLGFKALATTSSGFAATLGRLDGEVTRDEALTHAAAIAAATDLPVSADLENGFADDPAAVAETMRLAAATGLAGCSVEDYSRASGLYDPGFAAERVAAAAEVTRAPGTRLVLTARAENHIRANPDLGDTIARLQSFQAAGADVLFAPGLSTAADIRSVVESVDLPVNVLARPDAPTIAELRGLGVARVSVGGALSYVGWNAVAVAARELLEQGTYGFWADAAPGMQLARQVFAD